MAEVSQAFFKHSPHTNSISNSAILCNNYISLLSEEEAKLAVLEILRNLFVLIDIYCIFVLSLHIESTNSMTKMFSFMLSFDQNLSQVWFIDALNLASKLQYFNF